ncbi:hypothetical protein [Streptomyces sp. 900116325]
MNRLAASVSAAVVATGATLALLAPAAVGAAAPNTLEQVRAVHLGPNGPWFRLEDDPGNVNIPPGTEEVSPFADPVRFNGSLHLAVGPGQKSQAAHPFPR